VNFGNLIYPYYQDGNLIVSSSTLLFNDLPHFDRPIIGQPEKIHTFWQGANVYLRFGLSDLAGDELLTLKVHYG